MAVHLSAHGRRRRQRLLLEVFALLIVVRIRGLVFWLGNPRQVHLSTATTPTHASVVVVLHEFLSRLLFGHLLDPSAFPCVWWPTMTRLKVTPQFCFKRLIINLGILLLAFIDLIDIDGPASKRPVLDDFARHLSRGLFERARRRRARPAKRGALGAARAAAHVVRYLVFPQPLPPMPRLKEPWCKCTVQCFPEYSPPYYVLVLCYNCMMDKNRDNPNPKRNRRELQDLGRQHTKTKLN